MGTCSKSYIVRKSLTKRRKLIQKVLQSITPMPNKAKKTKEYTNLILEQACANDNEIRLLP